MKSPAIQANKQRRPTQKRAQEKVELILEASMRLMVKGGLQSLTTNAVAETAGVSIGTLYQYFSNKEAILDALADREMERLSERVLSALGETGAITPSERMARVIRAIVSSYGGRRQVHRIVMEYSLSRGGKRLVPLLARLAEFLSDTGRLDGQGRAHPISRAEAFVLINAFAGVMRAIIMSQAPANLPQEEIEAALVKLMVRFAANDR